MPNAPLEETIWALNDLNGQATDVEPAAEGVETPVTEAEEAVEEAVETAEPEEEAEATPTPSN